MSNKAKVIAVLVLVAVAFLAGFIPQYLNARSAGQQRQSLEEQVRLSRLRDLNSYMFLEVSRNNYGTAAEYATRFFREVRTWLGESPAPGVRAALERAAARQDEITAGLAKADPAVRTPVQEMLEEMLRRSPELGEAPAAAQVP
jgi:hypothetical protein